MTQTAVSSDQAPDALGPYSQAIIAGGLVFCSGMAGIDPATGAIADGIEAQTEQVLLNLAAVLSAAGSSMDDVVKTRSTDQPSGSVWRRPTGRRWALYEAAQQARHPRSPDREYYLQAAERIGGNRACLALARKLLKRCYHTLRDLGDQALTPA